ncbi:MAG: adenylosuccinate lyase [Desulfovibrio sp.]|nr:adenylosuccinate lyase [Desulfovibrio sp.]
MIERYTRAEMSRIWTMENRCRAWLTVELAVCEAWRETGRIPGEAMDVIRSRAAIDVARILEIEKTTRHDVIAFLTSLEEKVGHEARYIHLGCTSSDIVDTANALLLQQAGELILKGARGLLKELETLARRYKGVLCMGRTHGVHAEPTSFGLKIAGFYAEFVRHLDRIAAALESMRVGKISGAVGTYASLSPELEAKALARLNLKADEHSTQIIQRDRHAQFFSALAIMAGGIERLCVELRHLQRTEVLEAEEGFSKGQKGSSAMPHKKNPISAENICGISRLIRSNALAAMENQALWHERDISHSSVERVIMPDSTILADYALTRLAELLRGLVVNPGRMRENMEKSFGLCFSQRLLTALVETGLPRQKAYETVQPLAMRSWEERRSFPELVKSDAGIRARLTDAELEDLFDMTCYLRHEDAVYARLFTAPRQPRGQKRVSAP